mgnify:CR=1 FL=1
MQPKDMVAELRRHPFDKDLPAAHIERLAADGREHVDGAPITAGAVEVFDQHG